MAVKVVTVVSPHQAAILIAQGQKKFHELVMKASWDAAMATEPRVSADSPVDTGYYKGRWQTIRLNNIVGLYNDAPYAGIIEHGSRPHWVPIQPLIDWAERKAGDLHVAGVLELSRSSVRTRADGTTAYRGRASLRDDDRAAVRSFAYAVQHAIAQRGTRPQYVMKKQMPFLLMALKRSFEEQLATLDTSPA